MVVAVVAAAVSATSLPGIPLCPRIYRTIVELGLVLLGDGSLETDVQLS